MAASSVAAAVSSGVACEQPRCCHASCAGLHGAAPWYHANVPWGLPKLLMARGLRGASAGQKALASLWRQPPGAGPGQTWSGPALSCGLAAPDASAFAAWLGSRQAHRGVVEMLGAGAAAELSHKGRLAAYLASHGLSAWAPPTARSARELEAGGRLEAEDRGDRRLWFLKHAEVDGNAGVTVHRGRAACSAAWLAAGEEAGKYVAQPEVADPLLDELGRKVTLRVFVLVAAIVDSAEDGATRLAWAHVRREFLCRKHPKPYDSQDPDLGRHVHSAVGEFEGVACELGSHWPHRECTWPAIRQLLTECLEPFLPKLARSKEVPQPDGTGALEFDLLGVDVLVDARFRPWFIEVNLLPALSPVHGDTAATAHREAVVEDVLAIVLDPALRSGCLRTALAPGHAWEQLACWEERQGAGLQCHTLDSFALCTDTDTPASN